VRLALDAGGEAMIWLEDGPLAPLAGALTGTLVRASPSPSPAGHAGGHTIVLAGSLALEAGGWHDAGVLMPWMTPVPPISMADDGHASQASHRGWTAEVLAGAHLVRIADGRGTRGWVICTSPQSVAWIDGALVVAADGGLVVQVVDIAERLG
jgi:hypothetical protein